MKHIYAVSMYLRYARIFSSYEKMVEIMGVCPVIQEMLLKNVTKGYTIKKDSLKFTTHKDSVNSMKGVIPTLECGEIVVTAETTNGIEEKNIELFFQYTKEMVDVPYEK